MKELTKEDAAYLAGLYDGEGCIGYRIRRSDGYPTVSLDVCMTDSKAVDWAQSATGCGKVYFKKVNRGNRRDVYYWKVTSLDQIAWILKQCRPYMKTKFAEASAMILAWNLRQARRESGTRTLFRDQERIAGSWVTGMKKFDFDYAKTLEEVLDLACYLRAEIEETEKDGL